MNSFFKKGLYQAEKSNKKINRVAENSQSSKCEHANSVEGLCQLFGTSMNSLSKGIFSVQSSENDDQKYSIFFESFNFKALNNESFGSAINNIHSDSHSFNDFLKYKCIESTKLITLEEISELFVHKFLNATEESINTYLFTKVFQVTNGKLLNMVANDRSAMRL